MPFLLYVRPLSVFNLIHHNMKLIVEVFFFNSDSIYQYFGKFLPKN